MSGVLNILFAGTPEFSVPALRALLDSCHRVVAVYTQPDRPAGRGRKLTASPVKRQAIDAGLSVRQPLSFKSAEALRVLEADRADLMVVVAYGLLLPEPVLASPRLGCVNIHASLLPRWRGAAPIQRCLLAGDKDTGITIMQMDRGLDTGPMYLRKALAIAPDDTSGSLHDKLASLGAQALMEALPGIVDRSLVAQAQDERLATYAKKVEKLEGEVDWSLSAEDIARLVRAFNPWPIAYTHYRDRNLRLWSAAPVAGGSGPPGTVVAAGRQGIDVATGDGRLRITRLQVAGKKPLSAEEFLNAHSVQGALFG